MGLLKDYWAKKQQGEAMQQRRAAVSSLLGNAITTTGQMQGADIEYDEQGNPIVMNQTNVQQSPFRQGSGYLGSNRSAGDLSALNAGLLTSGFDTAEARQITSPFESQTKNAMAMQKAGFERTNKMQEQNLKQGNVLRKERSGKLASFNEAKTQYNTTMNALKQNTGAATLAAIFSFMKTLDPRSVVREGEFAMGTQTGGVVDSLVGMVNRAKGEGMGPQARKGIAEAIQAIMEGRVEDANAIAEQFDVIAGEQNVPLSQIKTGEFNPELQGIPGEFYDDATQTPAKYEYRVGPNGKQQRKRIN